LATDGERGPVRPPRPPRLWPWLVAILVVVLAGLAGAYVLTRDDDDESATVPNVIGLLEREAVRRIEAADLRARSQRFRTGRAAGRVFLRGRAQAPRSSRDRW
jgi:hypothetical protein